MMEAIDMGENIFRQGTDDLLISGDPHIITGIGHGALLVVLIFNFNCLWRFHVGALEEPHNTGTTECGHCLSLPGEEVVVGEFHGRRSADRACSRGG
jgi:hypothetical protein